MPESSLSMSSIDLGEQVELTVVIVLRRHGTAGLGAGQGKPRGMARGTSIMVERFVDWEDKRL